MGRWWSLLLLLASVAVAQQQPLSREELCPDAPPIEIRGKHFYRVDSGTYVPIKGITYYPRPNAGINDANNIDFFTEEYRHVWERDIPQLQAAHVNAIRIYAVDPSKNHDAFMCALKSAGIYALIGLAASCDGCAITQDPAPACYPTLLRTRGEFIISVFAKYDNVLGFSAGNEVSLGDGVLALNGPCQKKFLRDMRAYIQSCPTMRKIPMGVIIADVDAAVQAAYYNCRTNPTDLLEEVEWFGINSYRHCDGTRTNVGALPGPEELLANLRTYAIPGPVMITEYGCLHPSFPTINGYEGQRNFLQTQAFYRTRYLEEMTGGFVYSYSTEKNWSQAPWPFTQSAHGNFGIGYFSGEFCDDVTNLCEYVRFPQFDSLATTYGAINVTEPPNAVGRNTTQCPTSIASVDDFVWPTDTQDPWPCPDPFVVYCPFTPECAPTAAPTASASPSGTPTTSPTDQPSRHPSSLPTTSPSHQQPDPTARPSDQPTRVPTITPTPEPTAAESSGRPSASGAGASEPTGAPDDVAASLLSSAAACHRRCLSFLWLLVLVVV